MEDKMNVRVGGRIVRVPDYCRKSLERIKKGWGSESIGLDLAYDLKTVEVHCIYVGTIYRMKILKGVK
jgi:hypothetical protein